MKTLRARAGLVFAALKELARGTVELWLRVLFALIALVPFLIGAVICIALTGYARGRTTVTELAGLE